MPKHFMTKPGTQRQPKPISSGEASRSSSPGPPVPGRHNPAKPQPNIFNIDAGGRGDPAAVKQRLDALDRARPEQTSGRPTNPSFPKNRG